MTGRIKVVFFDAAGTLFEPREQVGASYARIAQKYGVEATAEEVHHAFRRVFGRSPGLAFGPGHRAAELRVLERRWWYELVAASFEGLGTFTDFDRYFDELFAYFADPDHWRLDPQAPPALTQLRDASLELGMISNFDYRLYRILDGLGLQRFLDSVTISSEAGYAKPAPAIFEIALAKHRARPSQAMHVGDVEQLDVMGALAAGIRPVLLDPATPRPWRHEGESFRAASLEDVAALINSCAFPSGG